MVRFWHQLGFIVKAEKQLEEMGELPVLVETERGSIRDQMNIAAPTEPLPPPVVEIPQPEKGAEKAISTVQSLKDHLQSAITVELSTIPLYLFAMYSIKIPDEFERDPKHIHPVINAVRSKYPLLWPQ